MSREVVFHIAYSTCKLGFAAKLKYANLYKYIQPLSNRTKTVYELLSKAFYGQVFYNITKKIDNATKPRPIIRLIFE